MEESEADKIICRHRKDSKCARKCICGCLSEHLENYGKMQGSESLIRVLNEMWTMGSKV
jgi:hypothetical protein